MTAIKLENIDFSYQRKNKILHNINIDVPKGSIYGFLGKNGAGKTTTLRVILGLLKPSSGNISVFGKNINSTYPNHLANIGPLIEGPALYGHLSANDNLRITCKYTGVKNQEIDRVLKQVNLAYAKNKKAGKFSTGMKQRLGLAIALLQDPDILILDEPTNGLDPSGIIEFRNILFDLKNQGKTIILSSHILSEVEKIVSKIGIIQEGKMIFEGTIDELNQMKSFEVRLRVSNAGKAKNLISNLSKSVIMDSEYINVSLEDDSGVASIIKLMVENNIEVYSAVPQSKGLEEMFISVTE